MSFPSTGSSTDLDFLGTDRFELKRLLGRGSMGAVYLAHDRERKMDVALKTLRRVDGAGIYRFKREFRALSDMVHPNLVVLHELFQEKDTWFFTMEYVEGRDFLSHVQRRSPRSLRPKLRSTPGTGDHGDRVTREFETRGLEILFPSPLKDEERLRGVLLQITSGLMAIHGAGKLHRDLKSDNVLVTEEGRAVVLDFGIIVDRAHLAQNTLDGAIGTPAYMSPEQAAGKAIGEPTDWYALGVMLYEALTGDVPFDGTYLQVIQQKQMLDPPPPSQLVAGVSPDLDQLCVQLLRRDPSQRPRGESVARALEQRSAASVHPRPVVTVLEREAPFIGRKAELEQLEAALAATDSGRPVLAFVSGPSGIGKSALVEHFLVELESSERAVMLQGRCYERERVAFKAFDSLVDSLSRYLRRLHPVEAAQTMPRDIQALAQLFPVLRRVEIVDNVRRRGAMPPDPQEVRRRAFAALREMFCRIADRNPLVLFIDDLQWGDVDSASLIAELLSVADSPAILLVATYRTEELANSPCLQALFEYTRRDFNAEVRHVALKPLNQMESMDLAQKMLPTTLRSSAASIGVESRGNPHLLIELVDHVRARNATGTASQMTRDGMVSFERALDKRIEDLSRDGRTLLQLLSVAGRPVSEDILGLVSAFDIDLQSALIELRGAKLIRGVGSHDARAVENYHDRIRETVLARMQPDELVTWHRRLAVSMEASGTADLEALIDHLLGAKDFGRAEIYALRAAQEAEQQLAFDKAARLYSIAVKTQTDAAWGHGLLVQWADALANAGRGVEAAGVYFDASRRTAGAEQARLERRAAIELLRGGRFDEAMNLLSGALAELGVRVPDSFAGGLEELSALRATIRARGLRFSSVDASCVPPERLERVDLLWGLAVGVLLNDMGRALPLIAGYLLEALELGEPNRLVRGLCLFHAFVDRPLSTADAISDMGGLDSAEALQRQGGTSAGRAWIALAKGFSHTATGRMPEALALLQQAEVLFRTECPGSAPEMRLCRLILAAIYVMEGQTDRLGEVEQWAVEAEEHQDGSAAARLRVTTTFDALRLDDPARAAPALDAALNRWGRDENNLTAFAGAIARSAIHIYTGDSQACRSDVRLLEDFLATSVAMIPVLRARATLWSVRAALVAARGSAEATSLLERCTSQLAELAALPARDLASSVTLLRGCLAAQRGDLTAAAAAFGEVEVAWREGGVPDLLGASALRSRGLLLGGPEGARDVREADAMLRRLAVVDPARFVGLYVPLPHAG